MWASAPYRDHRDLLIRCSFPINYDRQSIDGPVDLDLHVALLARAGELKFSDLPITLSPQELVRLSMKSAALWSLLSMAKEHDAVAIECAEASKQPGGAARLHLRECALSSPKLGE
jgi:hypothetical protein